MGNPARRPISKGKPMSYERIDDGQQVTVRKNWRCEWCGELIPKGSLAVKRAYRWDDEFKDKRQHLECYAALERHCRLSYDGEFYPRENPRGQTQEEYDREVSSV